MSERCVAFGRSSYLIALSILLVLDVLLYGLLGNAADGLTIGTLGLQCNDFFQNSKNFAPFHPTIEIVGFPGEFHKEYVREGPFDKIAIIRKTSDWYLEGIREE